MSNHTAAKHPGGEAAARPVMLTYCATFLPKEMLHVYRQVTGIGQLVNHVVTRTRANAGDFPYPSVLALRKSPWRMFSRLWHKCRRQTVPLSAFETRQMLAASQQTGASLSHLYLGTEAIRAISFLRKYSGSRVVSFHGSDLSQKLTDRYYANLWPHAELFLCRSQSLRNCLLERGCPADRIRLNYTGVPLPPGRFQPRALPAWSQGETLRILQVSRLIDKKGLDVTLRASRLLKDIGIPVALTIAGEGPAAGELKKLAGELGIQGQTTFAGFIANAKLEQLFASSHLFVHPSRTTTSGDLEGIPNSILEAMSHGLPIVSTRHSGIPEAVTDGVNGLLIDAADPEALSSAVERLVSDAHQFQTLSETARLTVERSFSTQACITSMETSYLEALSLRTRRVQ